MASVAVASDVRDSTKNQQKEKVGLTKQIELNECMQGDNNISHNIKNLIKVSKPNELLRDIANLKENINSKY